MLVLFKAKLLGGSIRLNWMGNLQQLGRSLMLPTIALPIAAVLLRLGDLPWDVIHASSFGDMLAVGWEYSL